MEFINKDIEERIKLLEDEKFIDPACRMCRKIFYPSLIKGMKFSNIFAPRHKASNRCESGKESHCTCDVCF